MRRRRQEEIKMKVCMLNPFFLPYQGGTEKHVWEVGRRLVKKGFEVTVLTTLLPGTAPREEIDGIVVERVGALMVLDKLPPYSPVPPPIAVVPAMSQKIEEKAKENEILHIHNRFFYSPEDAKKVKRKGAKLCITLHNARTVGISPATDFFGTLYDEVRGQKIMENCDAIAAVSTNTREVTVPKRLWGKARTIYNGVNAEFFNPKNSGEKMRKELGLQDEKMVLTVCRLAEQKGLKYLIEAAKKFSGEHEAKLVILGVGSQEEELRELAKKLGVENKVVFVNRKVPEEDLAGLYAACDVFALASTWEPFGMAICEAMSTAKPVVATTAGGIPEIVTPETGFLVEPKNADQMASKIGELLADGETARKMGLAGRKRVEENFTWDHTTDRYEKMYFEVMEKE